MPPISRKRSDRGSRKLDMAPIRKALEDRRQWFGLGLVWVEDGEDAHWFLDPDVGILVSVQLMPDKQPLECRLGGYGSGGTQGVWRIPPVGSEVLVGFPDGELANDPAIVAVLASGATPGELDADTLVVKAPNVVIIAGNGTVELGQKGLAVTDGLVHGTGVDTFTGATYYALGSTASSVSAKK